MLHSPTPPPSKVALLGAQSSLLQKQLDSTAEASSTARSAAQALQAQARAKQGGRGGKRAPARVRAGIHAQSRACVCFCSRARRTSMTLSFLLQKPRVRQTTGGTRLTCGCVGRGVDVPVVAASNAWREKVLDEACMHVELVLCKLKRLENKQQ
eukprot:364740-Chlamydomonas_euryale.AAC.7